MVQSIWLSFSTEFGADVRSEIRKRNSSSGLASKSSYSLTAQPRLDSLTTLASLAVNANSNNSHSALSRLQSAQSSILANNTEILRDLFWTLFSKLDAVLQGFRVAYEVAMRIGEVCLSFTIGRRNLFMAKETAARRLYGKVSSVVC